jgi:HD-GYP domain-containing protein (c-di-GMP phosphodiesterase class II)
MDDSLLQFILHNQEVEYALFDSTLQLKYCSTGLTAYLFPDKDTQADATITEVFSELIGYEEILTKLQIAQDPPLQIERIKHGSLTAQQEISRDQKLEYFNLYVYPYQEGLLVVIRNISEIGQEEQQIVQRRNELDLLNTQLINDLKRANIGLAMAHEMTLEGWAKALELRDVETEGHSERVTSMTIRLARTMGMSTDLLPHLHRGALLHDIGKMGIPDRILLKPGTLDTAEWEIMRLHPVYAQQMISPIVYLAPALDIPYCHHEKWDGSGYPRALRGEEIPLSARIFAVVDVYDALSSNRPYRSAWPKEQIIRYIRKNSGSHFDPYVVQVFLSIITNEA